MAFQNSLKQASRISQQSRLRLVPSPSQSFLSHSSPSARSTLRARCAIPGAYSGIHQARPFSLWPSVPKPADAPASTSNVVISDPSSLESTRTIKADSAVSDFSYDPYKATPIEPQILEDAQQAIARPHGEVQAPSPEIALEDIPERIGYLKEVCGLDFGWGPSSIVQWVLEHIHIWGGLSWTASMLCIGILLRTSIFPLMVRAQYATAALKELSSYITPLRKQHQAAQAAGDMRKMGEIAQEMRYIMQSRGIKGTGALQTLMPIFVQIPFGFGAWRVLRNAAETPVPGFVTEQWLWLNDLTFGDPYYLLPLACAGFTWATLKVGKKSSQSYDMSADMKRVQPWLERALPAITFLFICFQPGAVQTYFMASTTTGFLATTVLNYGPTRKVLGLPPRSTPSPPPVSETQESGTTKRPTDQQRATTTQTDTKRKSFIKLGRSNAIEVSARDVTNSTDSESKRS